MATVSGFSYDTKTTSVLKAGADYSAANEYVMVMVSTAADDTGLTATANARVCGVRMNKPNSGEAIELAIGPVVPVRLGGTVTRGDIVKSDANGLAVLADTDKDKVAGKVSRSGVSGDIVPMFLQPLDAGI
jgi:hypothetical protein